MLFRIKAATRGASNAPAWTQLFVQGVGNYLQGFAMAFDRLDAEQTSLLRRFIEERLLAEVSACQTGVGTFSAARLRR